MPEPAALANSPFEPGNPHVFSRVTAVNPATIDNRLEDGYPSRLVSWSILAILSLTYMVSFLDRQILVLLIEPIKADLQISDTEISLLSGLAFASVYTLFGIPMAGWRTWGSQVRHHDGRGGLELADDGLRTRP